MILVIYSPPKCERKGRSQHHTEPHEVSNKNKGSRKSDLLLISDVLLVLASRFFARQESIVLAQFAHRSLLFFLVQRFEFLLFDSFGIGIESTSGVVPFVEFGNVGRDRNRFVTLERQRLTSGGAQFEHARESRLQCLEASLGGARYVSQQSQERVRPSLVRLGTVLTLRATGMFLLESLFTIVSQGENSSINASSETLFSAKSCNCKIAAPAKSILS